MEDYINDKNLSKFDHWLYGPCNNETDTKGISHLITQEYFNKSACIKKYYNLREQNYYDINHPNFRWPIIEQGTVVYRQKFYSIIIEKCEEKTLNQIFNDKKNCKYLDFENYFESGSIIFNFIDHEIDDENYFQPIKIFFNRIENKLSKDYFFVNNIYLDPTIILNNYYGITSNRNTTNYTYTLDRNDIYLSPKKKEKDIYMGFNLWLNRRINYYCRDFMTFTDALSNIGGISSVIISIFFLLIKYLMNMQLYVIQMKYYFHFLYQLKKKIIKMKFN